MENPFKNTLQTPKPRVKKEIKKSDNPLFVELEQLRAISLSEQEVEKLIGEIEDAVNFQEDVFEEAEQNIVKEIEKQDIGLASFGVYEKARELIIEDPDFLEEYEDGKYDPITNEIGVRPSGNILSSSSFHVAELAINGYLHDNIAVHHEYAHSLQYGPYSLARIIPVLKELATLAGQGTRARNLLKEIHAHEASLRFADRMSAREFFKNMRSKPYRLIKDRRDIRKMLVGIWQIKALYALGLSDQGIGDLVQKAKWDKDIRAFDVLKTKIDELMTSRKISKEELNKMTEDEDIKTQIYTEKVKIIAQEELKRMHKKLLEK